MTIERTEASALVPTVNRGSRQQYSRRSAEGRVPQIVTSDRRVVHFFGSAELFRESRARELTSFPAEGGRSLLRKSRHTPHAATPPVDVVPAAMSAAVVRH